MWSITVKNANLSGVKVTRGEVDQTQGSGEFGATMEAHCQILKKWIVNKTEKSGPRTEAFALFHGLIILCIQAKQSSVLDFTATS